MHRAGVKESRRNLMRTRAGSRRHLPWLLSVPLIVGGSVGAHALGSLLFYGPATEQGADEVTRASGGYAAQLPLVIGVLAALALVGIVARILRSRNPGTRGVAPLWFIALPPLSFALQELSERLLHAESSPFSAIHEPAFVAALVLQLPFGFLAYLLARFLTAVAEEVGRLLARSQPLPGAKRSAAILLPPLSAAGPRSPVLASGHSQRGPPAPGFSF
jgi:hypothetical protein